MKWKELLNQGDVPQARSSHSISSIGNNLILWGGEHNPRVPVENTVHIYDINSQTWFPSISTTTDSPCLRVAHAAAVAHDQLYIHGGRTEIAEDSALGDLWTFNPTSLTWSQIKPTSLSAPEHRNFHTMDAIGTSIYLFGGCGNGGRLNDLWRFDTRSNEWHQLPSSDAIQGRGGPGFTVCNDSLWILGGFTGKESKDIHRFDLRTNTWQEVTVKTGNTSGRPFTARSVFAMMSHTVEQCSESSTTPCSHCNHILVFGGEVDPSDQGHAGAGQFSDSTFCLDTANESWQDCWYDTACTVPQARGWMASCRTSMGMVIHGGVAEDNSRLGDMYVLDVHA